MEPNAYIKTAITNQIATITFYSAASNSFPSSLLEELTTAITQLNTKPEVTTIILQSEGTGAFCAGASFDELLAVQDKATGKKFFSGFANVINAMRKSSKIFIGRIHGKTVGGGVGLAASCDYCFATEKAAIKLSELAIGIGPFVIEPAVSRKIGKTAFTSMSLAAHEWKTASWAQQHGLYDEVYESVERLDLELNTFAKRVSTYNPEALIEMKQIFWEGTSNWDELLTDRAEISGRLVLSDFTIQALNAFKNK
ncbi:enoyl-CoA hydratase/isomerase family protein [Myroides sp. 1354]|uniref:enoyl-CoA hydratase/isomerase family protein n=1 Tax=unclassified Myroides TaxID=2642485 RepID=UPI0025759658|nr:MULTISPECIES: enoyl-CoA hydratase/isomerase family protein [unclassified Myroides]MDM1043461.1 enoyl-CoA hydratase/isomerase family protein [Myroides sp. R163-1]MDM1054489.1 enoyl-CoA hydratase/isomerase family protein [Myroides sp. 1354]MDM1067785.1 enoyl-CoA hydratase/isomerase family protein [Myroides sp. 1372]